LAYWSFHILILNIWNYELINNKLELILTIWTEILKKSNMHVMSCRCFNYLKFISNIFCLFLDFLFFLKINRTRIRCRLFLSKLSNNNFLDKFFIRIKSSSLPNLCTFLKISLFLISLLKLITFFFAITMRNLFNL
jgi:hypothetical protein